MAGETERSYPCLGTLLKAENIDAVIAVGCVGYPSQSLDQSSVIAKGSLEEYRQRMIEGELALVDGLIERVDRYGKPLIITASTGRESKAITKLEQSGIHGYSTPEEGAKVLSHLVRYSEYMRGSSKD